MMYGNSQWRWLTPALLAPALAAFTLFVAGSFNDLALYCSAASGGVTLILCLHAWAEFRAYYREIEVSQLSQKRAALADTAENRLAQWMSHMHPETVRLFFKHRLEVWRVREMKDSDSTVWVLDADPRVNVMFVEYVLKNSNPYALMAKRLLSDKSRSFDPLGVVSDYEQYDALVGVFQRRGWLTDGHGSMPPAWIEPWNPELAARKFGLRLYDEEVAEAEPVVSG
jgi:hypothetical protein